MYNQGDKREIIVDYFQDFFDLSLDIMMIADLKGNLLKVNSSLSRILGVKASWTSLDQVSSYLHPDDADQSVMKADMLIQGDEALSCVNRYRCVDRTYKWIHWTCSVNRESRLIYAIGRDITAQKEAEMAGSCRDVTEKNKMRNILEDTNKKFSVAFNNSPTMNFIVSMEDGAIVEANLSFLQFVHAEKRDILHKNIVELIEFEEPDHVREIMRIVKDQDVVIREEISYRNNAKELRIALLSAEKLVVEDHEWLLGILTDITELKEHHKQLVYMDKFNLLSSMSASIAHEVRNPMTTVKGFLQLLMEKEELHVHKDTFRLMVSELDRANSIISQYLCLANNKWTAKKKQNLNGIIEYMLPFIESDALPSAVHINPVLSPVPDFMLDEKEIQQLVLSLSRNAIEAMSRGGCLTIMTYCDEDQIVLEISDEGEGIPPDVMKEMFNPFFTTKDEGTGLGLAVSRTIAERHKARLEVKQSGLEGTTFAVSFSLNP